MFSIVLIGEKQKHHLESKNFRYHLQLTESVNHIWALSVKIRF